MRPNAVDRNPEDLGAVPSKLGKDLIVERHLVAAHWTPVGRVENEDDRVSAELAQAEYLVGCCVQCEVGRLGAGGKELGRASIRV
jgi:hypothetical protein